MSLSSREPSSQAVAAPPSAPLISLAVADRCSTAVLSCAIRSLLPCVIRPVTRSPELALAPPHSTGVLLTSNASASNNGLSVRPAMGWSSWSFVRRNPTEATIKAQAAALKNSGLSNHGFVYVNVDDFYQKCDSNGFVVDGFGRWTVD